MTAGAVAEIATMVRAARGESLLELWPNEDNSSGINVGSNIAGKIPDPNGTIPLWIRNINRTNFIVII
jgi:hypothetical protein